MKAVSRPPPSAQAPALAGGPPRPALLGPVRRRCARAAAGLLLGGAASVLAQAPALSPAQSPAQPPAAAAARALDCMIQPSQLVQVGSPAPGVIEQILVDRGDLVRKGQEIVRLNASVERASLALARERAAQQGELAAAQGARELAERELARADELYRKNFVSGTYRDKQRAEVKVASGRSTEAAERRKLADRELELATAQLSQRTLRAPIAGVVIERYLALGEYVDQKPVLRIAQIDPLRVDVLVPAAAFGRVNIGMTGQVTPELLDRRALQATVKTVDRVIDAASNTFRVRLELPNPGGALPAGLRCKVDLGLPAALAEPPRGTGPATSPATTAGPPAAAPASPLRPAAAGGADPAAARPAAALR